VQKPSVVSLQAEGLWSSALREQPPSLLEREPKNEWQLRHDAEAHAADADIANVLTMDEARRVASNIAKLPALLGANPQNRD